eukprot:2998385-Rhodomonas_salina.3
MDNSPVPLRVSLPLSEFGSLTRPDHFPLPQSGRQAVEDGDTVSVILSQARTWWLCSAQRDDSRGFSLEVSSHWPATELYDDHTYQYCPVHVQHGRTWDRYRWGHAAGYSTQLFPWLRGPYYCFLRPYPFCMVTLRHYQLITTLCRPLPTLPSLSMADHHNMTRTRQEDTKNSSGSIGE